MSCRSHGLFEFSEVRLPASVPQSYLRSVRFLGAVNLSVFIFRLHSSYRNPTVAIVSLASSSKGSKRENYEAPRITSNVKLNLQFLKRIKEKRGGAKPATGYRRKKVERDLAFEDEEEERRNFYDSNDYIEIELTNPVLLVDGYNMCAYWPKLKKHFKRGHLDYARQTLLEELVTFSAIKGTKVVAVFDATTSGLPDRKEIFQGVDVIYTATESADTWIEREVSLLKADGCPKVWVVTSDSVQQQCASAAGAFVWSCRFLISMINDAKRERDEILHDINSCSMKRRLLEDNLKPDVRQALKELKNQLLQAENESST